MKKIFLIMILSICVYGCTKHKEIQVSRGEFYEMFLSECRTQSDVDEPHKTVICRCRQDIAKRHNAYEQVVQTGAVSSKDIAQMEHEQSQECKMALILDLYNRNMGH